MNEILKTGLFEILTPILYLIFLSYAFTGAALKLSEAWKTKSFKKIWLYTWIILLGVYFFIRGVFS